MNNINSLNNYLLLTLIFCFPLIIIIGSAAINISTVAISIIVLLRLLGDTEISFFKNSLLIFLFIFILFIFVNSIFKIDTFDSFLKLFGYFRYLFLMIGTYIVLEEATKKQITFFININLVLILLIGIDIIYQYTFYENIFGFLPGMCDEKVLNCLRFSGIFGDELIAGAFICQIGLLMLFLKIGQKFNAKNLIIAPFFIFIFIIILFTGERNALLILFICIFFICFFNKKILSFILLFSFLLTIIFLLTKKNDTINQRFINLYEGVNIVKNSTLIERIKENPWSYHYQAAIELFLEKPFTGHGIKSFRVKCKETNIETKIVSEKNIHRYYGYRACSTHPHNYFLEFLAEQGLIGGLFYLGLFFLIFSSIYKKTYTQKEVFLSITIGSLILAIIFPIKPSGSFLSTFNASILFYILGFFMHSLKSRTI